MESHSLSQEQSDLKTDSKNRAEDVTASSGVTPSRKKSTDAPLIGLSGDTSSFLTTKKYIAVAGNIGAGKSTLVEFLCHTYGVKPVFEPHDTNPYLEDFYDDMERWAFQSQAYFLGRKFRLHLQAQAWPHPVIQDRTIYEDAEVFARNLYTQGIMEERDFQTYWELYQNIRDALEPPDLLICLVADVKTIQKRIKMRGRQMEQSIPVAYLKRLNALYEQWFNSYHLSPTVTIVTNKLDYMTDLVDRIDLLREIESHLKVL